MHLTFTKFDDVYFHIDAEHSLLLEIKDHFSYTVDTYKKGWDGTVSLFSPRKQLLYVGLFPLLVKFCRERGIEMKEGDVGRGTLLDIDTITEDEIKRFVKRIKMRLPEDIRYYQLDGTREALSRKRRIIISPTASGKSAIIYIIIRFLLDHDLADRVLLIVPSVNLVNQMYGDFVDYTGDGWDCEANIQRIAEGSTKEIHAPVVISTWQSIYTQPREYFAAFDAAIMDEAQHVQAKSLKYICESLQTCPYKIGTTGTLQETKMHRMVLTGLLGMPYVVATTMELVDQGYMSAFDGVDLIYLEHSKGPGGKYDHHKEEEWLIHNDRRNEFIRDLTLLLDGNTLILYTRVKHGEILRDLFEKEGKDVYLIARELSGTEKERLRNEINQKKNAVVLATFHMYSTGVNIPNLHYIVYGLAMRAKIKTLQSIGRVLRKADDGRAARVFDIVDNTKAAKSRAKDRLRYYKDERFPVKTKRVRM